MSSESAQSVELEFLRSARKSFAAQKSQVERAISQINDEQLHRVLHPGTNCVAVIIQHMSGSMMSRWTDVFTTDGEKPNRERDREFIDQHHARTALLEIWNRSWQHLFTTLDSLKPTDLRRTIFIRGQAHTVVEAVHRSLDHYAYHVGQIVLLAKVMAGDTWKVLSIPVGESKQFNERTWGPGSPR